MYLYQLQKNEKRKEERTQVVSVKLSLWPVIGLSCSTPLSMYNQYSYLAYLIMNSLVDAANAPDSLGYPLRLIENLIIQRHTLRSMHNAKPVCS